MEKNKANFQNMFQLNHAIMLIVDPQNGKIIDANPAACKFYGYPYKKLVKEFTVNDINIMTQAEIKKEMNRALKDKVNYFQFKHRLFSGEVRDVEIYTSKLVIDENEYLLSIIHDITDQKRIENELQKTAEKFKLIADNTSDSISILTFDKNLTYLYVNDSKNNEKGFSPDHLIGKSLLDIIHPDDKNNVLLELDKYLEIIDKQSTSSYELPNVKIFEFRIQSIDGQWRYMQSTVNALGKNLLAVSKDITKLKIYEDSLRRNKEKVENYLNIAAGIILSLDTNGNITLLNDNGYELLGYKQGELIGKNWFDSCIPKNIRKKIKQVFSKLMKGEIENVTNFENDVVTKDGIEKTIYWHNTVTYDEKNNILGLLSSGVDITNRIKTEAKLHASEEKFSRLFKTSPNVIAISNIKDEKIIDINDEGIKKLGYKRSQIIGKSSLEVGILTKEHRNHILGLAKKYGSFSEVELPVTTKSGEQRYGLFFGQIINLNEENYLFLTIVDITERVLTQNSLKESENSFRDLVENMMDGVAIVDENGYHIYVNSLYSKITGYSKHELSNMTGWDFTRPEDIGKLKQIMKNRLSGKNIPSRYDRVIVKKDGTEIIVEMSTTITTWQGKIRPMAIIHDVTQSRKIELDLLNSQKQFEDLYDNAPDMYFSLHTNGTILSVNQNGAKYLGYKKQQLIGSSVWKLVHKEDVLTVKNQIKNILVNGKRIHQLEFRKVKNDGTIIFVQERLQCHLDDSGKITELRLICRDITELNKNRQKILDYQNNLKLMTHELSRIEEREKRELAFKLHDVIGQSMAMAKIKLSEISKNMSIEDIQNSVDMAKFLVVDAIKKSRDLTYELSPPILHELGLFSAIKWYTEQISNLYDIDIQLKGIKGSFGCSDEIKIIIYRSIVELLNNILKYSHASKAAITFNKFNNHGRITIRDNGVGFKSKDMDSLTASKKFGLFSIKERISYVGGEFKIESKINVGTTATIKINL